MRLIFETLISPFTALAMIPVYLVSMPTSFQFKHYYDYIVLDCEEFWISLEWMETSDVRIIVSRDEKSVILKESSQSFPEKKEDNIRNKTVGDFMANVVVGEFLSKNYKFSKETNNCLDFARIAFKEKRF